MQRFEMRLVHRFTLCLPVSKPEQPSSVRQVWRLAGELVVDTGIQT